jgi:hypothetical protein
MEMKTYELLFKFSSKIKLYIIYESEMNKLSGNFPVGRRAKCILNDRSIVDRDHQKLIEVVQIHHSIPDVNF